MGNIKRAAVHGGSSDDNGDDNYLEYRYYFNKDFEW